RRLWHEEPGEMVVHHFALRADREVRGDETLRARERALAPGDLPHDGAPLEPRVRARAEGAAADGPERHPARIPVPDASGLDEGALADDFDLGLEARGRSAGGRFNAPLDPVGLQDATEGLADGRGPGLQLLVRPGDRRGAASEL